MNSPHIHSKSEDRKHQDAAAFIDSLCDHKESRYDSMSKPEIKTERFKSRGIIVSKTSEIESFAACQYGEERLPKTRQKAMAPNEFTYELVKLVGD